MLGDKPSNPELLDWLANHFCNIRLVDQVAASVDHVVECLSDGFATSTVGRIFGDRSLRCCCSGVFAEQRLDVEQIRDAVLQVSGRLDRSFGGKTVPLQNRQFVFDHTSIDHTRYGSLRRAIYLPVIRSERIPEGSRKVSHNMLKYAET